MSIDPKQLQAAFLETVKRRRPRGEGRAAADQCHDNLLSVPGSGATVTGDEIA